MTLADRLVVPLALAVALAAAPASSQTFPTRNITIVVPYPAGGATDIAARVISEPMAAALGQAIVIENVGGGGSTIATGRVARAAPDGYTLLLHQVALAANVTLFPKLPFNTEKELTGIGLVNFSPMVLVGRKTLAANSMPELAAWMKQQGGEVKIAHAGAGSLSHLCAVLLAQSVGAPSNIIPYRGGAPAMSDVIAGHADLYWAAPASSVELIKAGTIKAYVLTAEKLAAIPNAPSAVALGYKELDVRFWQGLFAPAGTPKPIIDRLNEALQLALADRKALKNFEESGMSVFARDERTPEGANALLRSEIERWGGIIRANRIEVSQ